MQQKTDEKRTLEKDLEDTDNDPKHKKMSKQNLHHQIDQVKHGKLSLHKLVAKLDGFKFEQTFKQYWDATVADALAQLAALHELEATKVEPEESYELPNIQRAYLFSELNDQKNEWKSTHGRDWVENRLRQDNEMIERWADKNHNDSAEEQKTFNLRWWCDLPSPFLPVPPFLPV